MDVSIIIVNYRSWKPLHNCLESLLSIDKTKINFEVIIVDNFSNDGKFDLFQNEFKDFIFIRNTTNSGFANGCNLGAKEAKGNYFLFLNPDTIISPETLNTLYTTYHNHSDIGILSCLQVDKKNRFFNQKNIFPSLVQIFGTSRFFHRKIIKKRIEIIFNAKEELFYPDWVTGAVIFISKDWFNRVNGWNEDYWLYFEDVEICRKISQKKGKIAVTRNTTILHEHGGSSRHDFETEHISKTEVIISKHVYVNNNFKPLSKTFAHILLIIFIIAEKTFLSLLSLFLFSSLKLRTNRYILKNLCFYYFNAIKEQTWLSRRAANYQRLTYDK
ncbi:glycosyltransferase family 2 protein [Flavobacterium aestuarii]|uniref:glycosyltransferase family 2 protein n=1 Tax=Flavobacterium aestuarii TaxID=3149227 RepID=UPI0032B485C6